MVGLLIRTIWCVLVGLYVSRHLVPLVDGAAVYIVSKVVGRWTQRIEWCSEYSVLTYDGCFSLRSAVSARWWRRPARRADTAAPRRRRRHRSRRARPPRPAPNRPHHSTPDLRQNPPCLAMTNLMSTHSQCSKGPFRTTILCVSTTQVRIPKRYAIIGEYDFGAAIC